MFNQIGLVGDEDDIYIFQCLLQEAIYLKLCEAMKTKPRVPEQSWEFKYITGTQEIV